MTSVCLETAGLETSDTHYAPNDDWSVATLACVSWPNHSPLYWIRRLRIDAFGTTPRSIRSWPLRGLRVLTHRSYRRSRSMFDEQADRSLTSERTSTNPTNLAASSEKTPDNASVSWRLRAVYAVPP